MVSSLLLAFTGIFFTSFSINFNSNLEEDTYFGNDSNSFIDPNEISPYNFASPVPSPADNEGENPEDEDDKDDDGIDDELESLNSRNVEVEYSEDEFHIDSELRQGDAKDNLQIELHIEDSGVELSMQYSSESEGTEGEELDFNIAIPRLIEYIDEDGNSRFSPDNDTIERMYEFDSFKPIQYQEIPITNSSSLHKFMLQTSDNNVTFNFYLAEEFVNINGASLAPQQMKFDLLINGFQYSSPSSALALDVNMLSDFEYELDEETEDEEQGYDHDEEWLKTSSTDYSGFFSWKEYATVDGANQSVGTWYAPKDGEEPGAVYISYPRGDVIFHDPEIGVAGILIFPGSTPNPGLDDQFPTWAIILISLSSIIIIFFGLMSKQEYRNFLLNRINDYSTGPHRLTMEDVLDNKIRNQIISIVLDEPGVHYSELERKIDTSSSNLAWHLDILETYHIINKRRVGRYLIFYPYVEKNPFANLDVTIVKSKTTLEIFQIIADHSEINQSQISKRMDMHRKTVKYHLDKLINAGLIEQKKIGTKTVYNSLQ